MTALRIAPRWFVFVLSLPVPGWAVTAVLAIDDPVGVIVNADDVSAVSIGRDTYYTLAPDVDPYATTAFRIRIDVPESALVEHRTLVVEIVHLDKGAGVIDARMNGVGAPRTSNYTRLNTNAVRSAYFEFPVSAFAPVAVSGVVQAPARPPVVVPAYGIARISMRP